MKLVELEPLVTMTGLTLVGNRPRLVETKIDALILLSEIRRVRPTAETSRLPARSKASQSCSISTSRRLEVRPTTFEEGILPFRPPPPVGKRHVAGVPGIPWSQVLPGPGRPDIPGSRLYLEAGYTPEPVVIQVLGTAEYRPRTSESQRCQLA